MFKQVLPQKTTDILALLAKNSYFDSVYLAGGSALALQMGHRLSLDLDFYTQEKFKEKAILAILKKIAPFTESQITDHTILGDFPEVKFSLFHYPYKMIRDFDDYEGINIASPEDIAAMKIGAVSSRGTKRDFIDLFFLAKQKFKPETMLDFYDQKYNNLKELYPHIIKSLTYFDDAEADSMPKMLTGCDWHKVKTFFRREAPKLLDRLLNSS